MKQLMKLTFTLVLLISVLGAGLKADAAVKPGTPEPVGKKPYEYDFNVTGATYNGFTGAKEMVITFDKNINPITKSDVSVRPLVESGDGTVPELPIVDTVITSANKLTITFKNLEFVDYINKEDFKLVIKKGKLYFDQLTDYELPFKFYDLTPGFESVFVNGANAAEINNKIFKYNEPRNIKVQVPPLYITKIETIHRYNGVTGVTAPNLSNIDVIADPKATRLKVELGADKQFERDLDRSTAGVTGFSMGQAGISELLCKDPIIQEEDCKKYDPGDDFQLTAYSESGRKLETRNFKMQINDRQKDFKISDYVKADAKQFGKPISLYDLMATPTTLERIMEGTQLSALNKLGVTYSVGSNIDVNSLEQLKMALDNDKFKTITLNKDINVMNLPADTLVIDRNLTIKGSKSTPKATITGNVQIGSGKDRVIRLENLTIDGDLTIDVGGNGIAVLDEVNVTGISGPSTQIISGGKDSVHLNNFKSSGGVSISNANPIRIVTTNTDLLNLEPLKFEYNAKSSVRLEVVSGKVNLILGKDISLAESNKFTVRANNLEDLKTDGLAGPYFDLNEQKVEEDQTPGITKVEIQGKSLERVNDKGNFDIDISEVQEYIKGSILDEKVIGAWTVKGQTTGWVDSMKDGGFTFSGVLSGTKNGFVILEASDESTVYRLTIQIDITSEI